MIQHLTIRFRDKTTGQHSHIPSYRITETNFSDKCNTTAGEHKTCYQLNLANIVEVNLVTSTSNNPAYGAPLWTDIYRFITFISDRDWRESTLTTATFSYCNDLKFFSGLTAYGTLKEELANCLPRNIIVYCTLKWFVAEDGLKWCSCSSSHPTTALKGTEGAFPVNSICIEHCIPIHVTWLCGDYIMQTVAYEGLTPNLVGRTSYLTDHSACDCVWFCVRFGACVCVFILFPLTQHCVSLH